MTQTATHLPIERILDLCPDAKGPNPQGFYQAHCPAHNDRQCSLSFKEIGDGVYLTCYAFCTRQEILAALDLDEKALHSDGASAPKGSRLTLLDLAVDKHIPWQHLMLLGLLDIDHKGIKIPYYMMDGQLYERYRMRTHRIAKEGSTWDTEGSQAPAIPYGLWKVEEARQAKQLTIVEGESDCWTLWLHKLPALGIPGANNIGCLQSEHIDGIDRIDIVQEPGAAGKRFPGELKKRLDAIGYKGRVYALDLHKECQVKDPNDLHKKDSKGFKAAFETAMLHGKALHREIAKLATHRLCDLQGETLPDTKWAIEPILPEGVTILGGKPKLGKSWLALSIQTAISSGGVALGQYPVERGQVLYISLEDNKKRLQKRSNLVLHNALASPDFEYTTTCSRINEGGLEQLEGWIQDHPRARLIVIDTWARFKPKMHGKMNQQYDEDYEALSPLQEMAGRLGVSILLVDHMRKMESEDPIDMISGSVGKTGAVDGFLLLYRKRGETDARLFVTGRDIEEEQELLLSFNTECASWVVKGEADDSTVAGTPQQQEILDELKQHEQGLTVKSLAERLGKNINTTRNLLLKLRMHEKVTLQNNVYSVVTYSKDSKRSNHSNHSNPSENEDGAYYATTQLTTVLTTPIVTPDTPINEPVESVHNGHASELTMVTTVTTDTKKKREKLPSWLIPGTPEWEKEVKRSGLEEMTIRRNAALQERKAL
jgi:AAA domain